VGAAGAPVVVSEATSVTPELIEGFDRLLPQLSRSAPPLDAARLAAIVDSPATVLFVATPHDEPGAGIVGSLTLALFPIPTGVRAWIEDVVVDESWGRRGIATALVRAALERAGAAGARTVDLTSRPSREAANRLYDQIGFQRRETNVYRVELD